MTRETVAGAARLARSSSARGTANKFDDNNLMQEVDVDTHFSETHTGIERPQPIGLTAVPLKQEEEQDLEKAAAIATDQAQHRMQMERLGQQIAPGGIGWENWRRSTNVEDDRFNSDQPKGKAAEPFVQYLEGNHSHPVVTAMDDRRVRPYGMNEGEGAHYAPDGSEQMTFFNEKGAYLVSLDGKSVKDKKNEKERFASLRHVKKDMQSHDGEKVKEEKDYKHEGKEINTEVRVTKNRIEFRAGDQVVGYYDKSSETWFFKGKIAQMEFSQKIETTAPKISEKATSRFETVGPTYLGVDSRDDDAPKGETGDTPYKQTYVKLE